MHPIFSIRRFAAATLVVALTGTGALAVGVPSAHAIQGSCDKTRVAGHPVATCNNYADAPVYTLPSTENDPIDRVQTTRSWFVCQVIGAKNPAPKGRKYTNRYWLYTVGDDNNRFGYTPATFVLQGDNNKPVPGVPVCDKTPKPFDLTMSAATPAGGKTAPKHKSTPAKQSPTKKCTGQSTVRSCVGNKEDEPALVCTGQSTVRSCVGNKEDEPVDVCGPNSTVRSCEHIAEAGATKRKPVPMQ